MLQFYNTLPKPLQTNNMKLNGEQIKSIFFVGEIIENIDPFVSSFCKPPLYPLSALLVYSHEGLREDIHQLVVLFCQE